MPAWTRMLLWGVAGAAAYAALIQLFPQANVVAKLRPLGK